MAYETILYERKGKIVYITLNRPHILNAFNDQMQDEMLQAHQEFDADDEAWVAIVSGAGRVFCSGADVRQRQLRSREELKRLGGPAGGIKASGGLMGLGDCVNYKPVIVAVHGYVLGVGFALAMACDLMVAAAETKLQIREVQRGLGGSAHWAALWFWGGGRFATEMATTGRMFTAEEAHHHGIINRVVPQDQLMAEAERMANEIIANPPLAVRANVQVSRRRVREMEEEASMINRLWKCYLTEDFNESAKAFMEKREPTFKGR